MEAIRSLLARGLEQARRFGDSKRRRTLLNRHRQHGVELSIIEHKKSILCIFDKLYNIL